MNKEGTMKLALFLLLAALIAAALSHPAGNNGGIGTGRGKRPGMSGSIGTGKGKKVISVQPASSDDKKRACLTASKVARTACEMNENVDAGILSKSKKKADPDKLAKCIEIELNSYNNCVEKVKPTSNSSG